jgi:hypothetical protein
LQRAETAEAVLEDADYHRKLALERCLELEAKLEDADRQIAAFRQTLESIAANSCCQPCREAGLVAKAALRGWERPDHP